MNFQPKKQTTAKLIVSPITAFSLDVNRVWWPIALRWFPEQLPYDFNATSQAIMIRFLFFYLFRIHGCS